MYVFFCFRFYKITLNEIKQTDDCINKLISLFYEKIKMNELYFGGKLNKKVSCEIIDDLSEEKVCKISHVHHI